MLRTARVSGDYLAEGEGDSPIECSFVYAWERTAASAVITLTSRPCDRDRAHANWHMYVHGECTIVNDITGIRTLDEVRVRYFRRLTLHGRSSV